MCKRGNDCWRNTGGEPALDLGDRGASVGSYRVVKLLTLRGIRGRSRGGGDVDPDLGRRVCVSPRYIKEENSRYWSTDSA